MSTVQSRPQCLGYVVSYHITVIALAFNVLFSNHHHSRKPFLCISIIQIQLQKASYRHKRFQSSFGHSVWDMLSPCHITVKALASTVLGIFFKSSCDILKNINDSSASNTTPDFQRILVHYRPLCL